MNPRVVALLGAPGAGKTTLCQSLPFARQFAMGEAARAAGLPVGDGGELRESWQALMPDLSEGRWLLDGFPRSEEQVAWLLAQVPVTDLEVLWIPMSEDESRGACVDVRGDPPTLHARKWQRYLSSDVPAVAALAALGLPVHRIERRTPQMMVDDVWRALGVDVQSLPWDWPLLAQGGLSQEDVRETFAAGLGWGPARRLRLDYGGARGSHARLIGGRVAIDAYPPMLEALVTGSWVTDFDRWPQAPGSPVDPPSDPSRGLRRACSEPLASAIRAQAAVLQRPISPPAISGADTDVVMVPVGEDPLALSDELWRRWLAQMLDGQHPVTGLSVLALLDAGDCRVRRPAHFQGRIRDHQAHAAWLLDTSGLSPDDRMAVRLAALCHDIGKGPAQATSGAHAGAGAAMVRSGVVPLPVRAECLRERVATLVARHGEPGNVIKGALDPQALGTVDETGLSTLTEAHWRLWMADVGSLATYRWTIDLAPLLRGWGG